MLIDDIFSKLSASDRLALMTAFEEGLTHYVNYRANRFIGIYTDSLDNLVCENKSGDWREGHIKITPRAV